jgi:hypothetical protein
MCKLHKSLEEFIYDIHKINKKLTQKGYFKPVFYVLEYHHNNRAKR